MTFHREFTTTTSAARSTIWALWTDINNWSSWNAGVAQAKFTGPFVMGAEFSMTPTGQDAMTSRLVHVDEGVAFTDETLIGDIRVTVEHRFEPTDDRPFECVDLDESIDVFAPSADRGIERVGAVVEPTDIPGIETSQQSPDDLGTIEGFARQSMHGRRRRD